MVRDLGRLSALTVKGARKPGYKSDGGGLYLQISRSRAKKARTGPKIIKSWVFRFISPETGRLRDMGLGSVEVVSLSAARVEAATCREYVQARIDPISERKSQITKGRLEAARSLFFKAVAESHIRAHRAGRRGGSVAGSIVRPFMPLLVSGPNRRF